MSGVQGGSVERRLVTVLFADLVGFTALSEQLDAEEVAAVQEAYFADVRQAVARYGGHLEKFIGDAAMAVFGIARTGEDDAERAVRAGLALTGTVEALSGRLGLEQGTLRLRVGVNSGEVALTAHDATGTGEWRVSGDVVNVAARLQAAAEPGRVLAGDATALSVAETIALDPPVELDLKGKSDRVRAWPVVTVLPERSRERAMGSLRAPLLGRAEQLAELDTALARVRGGATEGVIVVAPPGVGKSRLVDELIARASADHGDAPLAVARARLGPETISPAAAATQLILSALGDDGQQRPALERLESPLHGSLAAEMRRLLMQPETGAAEPATASASDLAEERQLRFRAWVTVLDTLAAGRSAIWLIEDLHWAGGDLLAFIDFSLAEPAKAGRLVLGTARPALLETLAARSGEAAHAAVLELPALDQRATSDLVDALVGAALPDSLVAAIVARSDGNPLFVEELLRAWVSVGALAQADEGSWALTRPIDEVSLPHTVQGVYAAQLDDLPGPTRSLVRRASVAGRYVPRRSLDMLAAEDQAESIDVARRRALWADAPPDVVVGPALRYRHALLRDAGYASLARADRAVLHARLAGWYERAAGTRVAEVAEVIGRHYAAAADNASRLNPLIDGDLDTARARRLAVEWLERGAERALADAAHESARALLREALAQADEAEPLVRARLLMRLGEATAYTADMDEGGALLGEAVELYRAQLVAGEGTGSEEARAAARAGYGSAAAARARVLVQQILFEDARNLAGQALDEIGPPDDAAIGPLLSIRAWTTATLEQDRAVMADADRALEIARTATDRRLLLDAHQWRAMTLAELGQVSESDWAAVEELATELSDWARVVAAARARAGLLVDDHSAEVWAATERAVEIAQRRGQEEALAWLEYVRAEAGFVAGDWDAAEEHARRAIDIGERNSYHRVAVRTWHVLVPIAAARGNRALLEHAARWYAERAASLPDSPYSRIVGPGAMLHLRGTGLLEVPVPDVASRISSFDDEPGSPSWIAAMETVIEAWIEAGMIDGARDAVARIARGAAAAPDTSQLGRGFAAYMRCRLAEVDGAPAAELRLLADEAVDHLRRSGAAWWIWKCLRILAAAGQATPAELDEKSATGARLRLADRAP